MRIMPKVIQPDVSVLAAKNGLVFLTANDWTLIADKAARVSFKEGENIVNASQRTHGIYVLLKGTAVVQLPARVVFPAIHPGEVCGEISFLDELPASASVVAKSEVEAYYIDRPTLQTLFELFPHLASRFYRSLAVNLAHRLRHLIGGNGGQDPAKEQSR